MRKLLCVIAVIAITGLFQNASAQNLDFKLVNKTGMTFFAVYVGASTDEEWGDDLLPDDVLADGESVDIEFTRGKVETCKWDIMVTKDKDGKKFTTVMGVNLCNVSEVTLKIQNGKIVYSTK